jgi:hypothetical protein
MITVQLTNAELSTVLAALRYFQEDDMGDPENRSDRIDDIATDMGEENSLTTHEIDELCEKLNVAGVHDDDSGKPDFDEDDEEDEEEEDLDDEEFEDDEDDYDDYDEEEKQIEAAHLVEAVKDGVHPDFKHGFEYIALN